MITYDRQWKVFTVDKVCNRCGDFIKVRIPDKDILITDRSLHAIADNVPCRVCVNSMTNKCKAISNYIESLTR